MKKLTKILSLLVCLALFMSATPVDMLLNTAFAENEGGEPAPISADVPEPVATEKPITPPPATEAPTAAPTEAPVEEPTKAPEPTAEPVVTEAPEETEAPVVTSQPTEDPNAINYAEHAGKSKAFKGGFAEILKDSTSLYKEERASSEVKAKLDKGVVYVIGRTDRDPDRVAIVFNAGPEIGLDSGWVDANRVRPMEPTQEIPAYIKNCAKLDDILCYKNRAEFPLAWIDCVYPEEKTEPEATQETVQEPTQEPTKEPTEVAPELPIPSVDVPVVVVTPTPEIKAEDTLEPETEETQEHVLEIPADETIEPDTDDTMMLAVEDVPLFAVINETGPMTLSIKMTHQLSFDVTEGVDYTFYSSDSNVAAISEAGLVTAKAAGDATITLQINEDVRDSWDVHVVEAPTFTLEDTTISLGVEETYTLNENINTDPAGTPVEYFYSVTSGGSYADVSDDGVITAKKGVGTTKVRVKNSAGKYVDLTVKVYVRAEEIKLSTDEITLGAGQSEQVAVSFAKVGGKAAYAQYELVSSDDSIATVAEDGTITAHSKGNATITARTLDGALSTDCQVEVMAAPTAADISFDGVNQVMLGKGETMTATASLANDTLGKITYAVTESSENGVLTVNATTGKISAKKVGTATVTAMLDNSTATASYEVEVVNAPSKISFTSSTLKLGEKETYQLKEYDEATGEGIIKIPENSHASYTFKSSNTSIVKVDSDGLITAKKKGTAKIRVTAQNGKYKDLTVKVYYLGTTMVITPSTEDIASGHTGKVTVKFNGSSSYYARYTLESGNKKALEVAPDGTLTAKPVSAVTPVTITATGEMDRDVTATCVVNVHPAPTSADLSFDVEEIKLGVGETATYTAKNLNDTLSGFTYTAINPTDTTVVKVSSAGKVTAKNEGEATIIATADNNPDATVSYKVTVVKAPTSVSFTSSTLKLGEKETYQLKEYDEETGEGIIKITENSHASYTFLSSDTSIVKVGSSDGVITAKKKGTAKIRVTAQNGKYKDLTVKVLSAATSMELTPSSENIGSELTGKVTVSFNGGSSSYYAQYTLESSNEDVLHVKQDGTLKAERVNEVTPVTITATGKTNEDLTASCVVNVYPAPTSVNFTEDSYQMSVGMTLTPELDIPQDTIGGYTYSTGDPSILSVDDNGTIKGESAGETTLTVNVANAEGNVSATVNVVVMGKPIAFDSIAKMVIAKGDTVMLPVPVAYSDAAKQIETIATFTYSSSDTSIAKIVNGNQVKGVKAGSVTITAKANGGKSTTFSLKVSANEVIGVSLEYTDMRLYGIGDSLPLNGEVVGTDLNAGSLTYESSNPSVASVTEDGIVTAEAYGTATITVTAWNGVSATCAVTVKALANTVTISDKQLTLGEGETYKVEPVFDPADSGARIAYIPDSDHVSVDPDGTITAIHAGSTGVTVTAQNDLLNEHISITVLYSPTKVTLPASRLYMLAGEKVSMAATLIAEAQPINDRLTYESSNSSVVTIDENGEVEALTEGTAKIAVTTCNGLTAECEIIVCGEDEEIELGFAWNDVAIMAGDSAGLDLVLNTAAINRGYSVESSNPDVLEVIDNSSIMALAPADSVTLTLMINGSEEVAPDGEAEGEDEETDGSAPTIVTATVQVIPNEEPGFYVNGQLVGAAVDMDVSTYTLATAKHDILVHGISEKPMIGTFNFEYDSKYLTYNAEECTLSTTKKDGISTVTVETFGGSATLLVTVLAAPVYRALLISEYNNSGASNDLPFAAANISNMTKMLKNANMGGQTYKVTHLPNPSEDKIKSGIKSAYTGAKKNDVSLFYVVSHGYKGTGSYNGQYCFGMKDWTVKKPETFITDSEIMSWIKPYDGKFVIIIDSCQSGQFITNQKSKGGLTSNGNVAVITAQKGGLNASFYYTKSKSFEFFTYTFCKGLGYDQFDGNVAVKADANADSVVTIKEAFDYAVPNTTKLVESYKGTSGFKVVGWKSGDTQTPQTYIPTAMKDLPIFAW